MRQSELEALLKDMSLQEKADQLLQLNGTFYTGELDEIATGPIMEMGLKSEDICQAGSILGTYGAERLKEIQKKYMEKQPHHIPMLFMMDVIHGMKTIFPMPLAMGAAFDPSVAYTAAEIAAKEASVSGLHVTFSPMADLVRDARWGRVMESTGEDAYMNSLYTAAQVKGFQGDSGNLREKYKVASCVKHFAAYGGAEAGRDYNTVELSEQTLREYYLRSYQAGIDAGVALVMTSFNTVNGVPASVNTWLMREVLRKEMGFEGVLISDYAAIEETICHGVSEDKADAAEKALKAGVDIDMMTSCYSGHLAGLIRGGKLEEGILDEAVMRVLQLKNKLGLFENPYKDADPEEEKRWILCEEHRKAARDAACKTFVLLKNERDSDGTALLPLKKGKKTAFIGPYVENQELLSSWAVTGSKEDCVTIRNAAEAVLGEEAVFACGCPIFGNDMEIPSFNGNIRCDVSEAERKGMLEDALKKASEAEQVVLCLGEHSAQSGEAASRTMLDIPEIQMELFREIYRVNQNIVVVLFSGRPLDLREISRKARTVLEVWFPGTEGGNAILDVLTGVQSPSGKLPMSFPYCIAQEPLHYDHYNTGRPNPNGRVEKFRSRYLDAPNEPLYPFGYGLTYTEFSLSEVRLDREQMEADGMITASVIMKNEGTVFGTETAQMYIRDLTASVVRPVRQLKGIQKVSLMPGESRTVSFEITREQLQFMASDGKEVLESGRFAVYIGTDSTTENCAEFVLI